MYIYIYVHIINGLSAMLGSDKPNMASTHYAANGRRSRSRDQFFQTAPSKRIRAIFKPTDTGSSSNITFKVMVLGSMASFCRLQGWQVVCANGAYMTKRMLRKPAMLAAQRSWVIPGAIALLVVLAALVILAVLKSTAAAIAILL